MRTMYSLYYRLLDAYGALGPRRIIWVAPLWLVRREYLVLVRDLLLPLPEVPPHDSMEWRPLTEADLPRVLATNPVISEAEIRRRLNERQQCLLCWIGGSLAHYRWDATASVHLPYLGKTLRLVEGEDTLDAESFTHPAFRGKGIYSLSSILALYRARDRGLTRSIGIVAWWNTPSLRAHLRKGGYAIAGSVGYWKVGPWRHYFATGEVCFDASNTMYVRSKGQSENHVPSNAPGG